MDCGEDIGPPPAYEELFPVQQPLQLEFPAEVSLPVQHVPVGCPPVYSNNQPQQQAIIYTSAIILSPVVTAARKPKNFHGLAIFATLCCCCCIVFPCGIAGMIYASKVDAAWARGDYAAAYEYSRLAKGCTTAAIVIGCCLYVLPVIIILLMLYF